MENNHQVDFTTIELDDFDNPEFCKTYLAHHGAEMAKSDDPRDPIQCYTLYWPHGFMCACPYRYGTNYANMWGCVFIFLWQYKKIGLPDADTLTNAYVHMQWTIANRDKRH